MSVFTIKMIAIITMIIDHVGLFLVPEQAEFRIIGRLSFPLFAWLIANGARHTKNINLYLVRLFVFGLISQIPFSLPHQVVGVPHGLNVLFTLFLGLLCIKIIKEDLNTALKMLLVVVFGLVAEMFQTDYGLIGVLSIVGFYLYFDDFKGMLVWQTVLWVFLLFSPIQPLAILSLIFIYFYNGKPGPKAKYLFYIVYPLQFLIFYFLLVY